MYVSPFSKGFRVIPRVFRREEIMPVAPVEQFLLLETGDFMLLETGDKIILE